jgi:putative transposase
MRRRKFSREFKLEAVKLVTERGVTVAQAARIWTCMRMCCANGCVSSARRSTAFPGHGHSAPELARDRGPEEGGRQAQGGARHPKKGRSLLREGSDMRFAFIAKHRHIWPVAWLCERAGCLPLGLPCLAQPQPISARSRHDEVLVTAIDRSFKSSDRTYGARRVWHDVLAEGLSCGLHRVERLMRENGLRARPRRRGLPKDDGERAAVGQYPRSRLRGFGRPNQKWVADFTYIWTAEGWLYVAVVVDLFSRRVVGWSMKAEMTPHLVTDALIMAIWRRGKADACCIIPTRAAIYQRAVPAPDDRPRHHLLDEPVRQRLGQCCDGELLLVAEDRADSPQGLQDEG